MIGLVIVSHSRSLADSLVDLIRQVTTGEIPIAVAAGVGNLRQEFGTDAVEISEAIQSVYTPDGVLILMDLGSAILSAEMALELLPDSIASRVRFCPGAIVEGGIAAAVQIGLGSDLDTVYEEARSALLPKIQHLASAEEPLPAGELPQEQVLPAEASQEIVLTLNNLHGLHARPAAKFVQTAAAFDAKVLVRNLTTGKGPVSAKSLNALATLGAIKDHQIAIAASGPQADEALQGLKNLVAENFGEKQVEETLPSEVITPTIGELGKQTYQAVPVSEGVALGPLYSYQPPLPPVSDKKIDEPEPEWQRLQRALMETRNNIHKRRNQLITSLGEAQTAIFEAHELILQDPDLLDDTHNLIYQDKLNAAAAWNRSIQKVAEIYQALDDPYLRQRAVDVLDVGRQVLFALSEQSVPEAIELSEPAILFAQELTPTETAQLDMSKVLGLVTAAGGPTSHSAILARAFGIPAVSGANFPLETLPEGTQLGLDGFKGVIWVDPPIEIQKEIIERRKDWLAERKRLIQSSQQKATTRDGRRIEVVANVGNQLDARSAAENGAEGIGLLRTEFLFLTRSTAPSEDEQVTLLDQIGIEMRKGSGQDYPMIVRTLDVGGDKGLPYLPMPAEANPFLGVRAIRLSLLRPDLFQTQLRAVLRASDNHNFRIMFPMISNLDEVLKARHLLEEAHLSLQKEKIAHRWPIETGIMVEVPAAALLAPVLAPHIDFFSIGTNDLTQYTLAAERGNPELSAMADALHPAVLRLIKNVVDAAHKHGKWVGVCGELAGDILAVPVLIGLGVDELSVNPAGIPKVKAVLRSIEMVEAQALAAQVLEFDSSQKVRELAQNLEQSHAVNASEENIS